MAFNVGSVTVELDALDKGFSSGISSAKEKLSSFGGIGEKISKGYSKGFETMQSVGVVALGGIVTGFGGLVTAGVKSQMSMETLGISLETALGGSAEKAEAAQKAIVSFAAKTPYQIGEVTDAFIGLTNMGLDAGEKALTSYGNTASAMGKPLAMMTEAVKDAATGEFERLKEFGIKTKKQGDDVAFTFKGVTTTVKNNSKEIEGYLIGLGETNFAGGMEKQSQSLAGLWSTLTDTISLGLASVVKEFGIYDLAKGAVSGLITYLSTVDIAGWVDLAKGAFDRFKTTIESFQPFFQPILDWFGQMNKDGELVKGVLAGLATALGVGIIGAIGSMLIAAAPFILVIGTIIGAVTGLWLAFQNPAVQTFVSGVWTNLVNSFNWFKDNILPILVAKFGELWTAISTELVPALQRLWDKISPLLLPVLETLGKIIGGVIIVGILLFIETVKSMINNLTFLFDALSSTITWLTDTYNSVVNFTNQAKAVWESSIKKMSEIWNNTWEGIKTIASNILSAIETYLSNYTTNAKTNWNNLGESLKSIWNSAWENVKSVLSSAISVVAGQFTGMVTTASTTLGNMKSTITGKWGEITGFLSGINLFEVGARIMKSLADGFSSMIGNVKTTIQNGITSAIGSIKVPSLQMPKMPGFASGVRNFGGGIALVGEQGPELVNLGKGSDVYNATDTRAMLSQLPDVGGLLASQNQGENTQNNQKSVNIDSVNITDNSAVNSFFNQLNRAIA